MLAIALAGLAMSMLYTAFAALRVFLWSAAARRRFEGGRQRVTIAKPLCGAEPELSENLRSFCEQEYPEYEVLFAVNDAQDAALPIARQFGEVIIEPRVAGANRKINSLIAIAERAKGAIIVVADSDMRVGPDYLRAVTAPFDDERVGAVTCLYAGRPLPGFASLLGAMYINEAFLPSVLVALAIQPLDFCLGATMAVRRTALESIGGFQALSGYLADDYMLGHRLRERGWDIRLAPYVVENLVSEPSFGDLFLHELRWARTIRTVRPLGYSFSILTMMFPWAVAVLLLSRFSRLALWMAAAAMGLRVLLQATVRMRVGAAALGSPAAGEAPTATRLSSTWLIPLRDALTFIVYCASHFGRSVQWKQLRFNVSTDGQLHPGRART